MLCNVKQVVKYPHCNIVRNSVMKQFVQMLLQWKQRLNEAGILQIFW